MTNVRPYKSKDHLQALIETERGKVHISPQDADRIVFDIAKANSLPENAPTSRYNGSTVLNIGRGVSIRASGSVIRRDGVWRVRDFYASQYPTMRDLTSAQGNRAVALINEIIGEWAKTHEGDIAQADDIERNNAAHTLEKAIDRHERALAILRDNLAHCEEGEDFKTYPDLPTKG